MKHIRICMFLAFMIVASSKCCDNNNLINRNQSINSDNNPYLLTIVDTKKWSQTSTDTLDQHSQIDRNFTEQSPKAPRIIKDELDKFTIDCAVACCSCCLTSIAITAGIAVKKILKIE